MSLVNGAVVCYTISRSRGISAAGSAQHWQCWGQRFESAMLHQNKSESVCRFGFFAFSTDAHIKKAGGVGGPRFPHREWEMQEGAMAPL